MNNPTITDYSLTANARLDALNERLGVIAALDLATPLPAHVRACLERTADATTITACENWLDEQRPIIDRAHRALAELHAAAPLDIDNLPGWHGTPWAFILMHPWHPDLAWATNEAETWLSTR